MGKAHARRHLRSVTKDLQDDIYKIRSAFTDAGSDVKGIAGQYINDSYENLRDSTLQRKEDFTNYVAEKPFKSLGLAVLSGVVIGFLIRR